MKNLAVVPVRSGSSRIKHKNIRIIAGHPLMYYQIECAKQVKEIDRIIVATDDKYYAEIAKSFSVDVIMRPSEISGSNSKSEETLLYVIDKLEKKGEFFDNVILLQVTSPLNCPEYVKEGIIKIKNDRIKSVLTYTEDRGFFVDDKDIIDRPMSQHKKPRKRETGCFWITTIKALKPILRPPLTTLKTLLTLITFYSNVDFCFTSFSTFFSLTNFWRRHKY